MIQLIDFLKYQALFLYDNELGRCKKDLKSMDESPNVFICCPSAMPYLLKTERAKKQKKNDILSGFHDT